MAKISLIIVILLFIINIGIGQKSTPPAIIFDTDMGPDYDDVGAITLLHAFADSGKIRILATVASTNYEGVAGVLNVLNTYFHRPELPIGVARPNGLKLRDWQHWTDTLLSKYPHSIQTNKEVPDAVEVYRKILSRQPDRSVTIVTVGFLTNISDLLKSTGDHYSSLNGEQLFNKKVKKMVSMAGRFPSGKEFNLEKDAAASVYVFSHLKIPVIFSGFEIGMKIKTGLPLINNKQIYNSPVKDVFSICIPKAAEDSLGRKSWDETAVLVAATDYHPYYFLEKGHLIMNADGNNYWNSNEQGQFYLKEKISPVKVQKIINGLIMHQPRQSKKQF
ncbi:MAG: nucleoside hydrolase [Flavisolibacter sp.]